MKSRRSFLKFSGFSILHGINPLQLGTKYQVTYVVSFPTSKSFTRVQFARSQSSYEKPEIFEEITQKFIEKGQLSLHVDFKENCIKRSYTFLTKKHYKQWQKEIKTRASFNSDKAKKNGFIITKTEKWVS